KVKLPLFGKSGPNVPVKGNIKPKQSLKADLNEFVPVTGLIPIDMLIVDTLPIGVQLKIPINLMVPVEIPLKTTAKISFSEPMPVNGIIPLALSIPVDIPLNETDLVVYLKKNGNEATEFY
ncbi:MAG: hypothetical protein Q8T08_23345, partial [Ignavibacteria bacterium]|nr:hypothetical protein [Ignavibacteria bacterium]